MRPCPYCGKEIQDEAIVCRYCGLDVERPDWLHDKRRCPFCAEWIGHNLELCPYCKSDLTEESALFETQLAEPAAPPVIPDAEEIPPEPEELYEEPESGLAPETDEELESPEEEIEELPETFTARAPAYGSSWVSKVEGEEPMRAVPLDRSGQPKADKPSLPGIGGLPQLGRPALLVAGAVLILVVGVGAAYALTRGGLPNIGAAAPTRTATPRPSPTPTRATATATSAGPTVAAVVTQSGCVEWSTVSLKDARKTMCVYGIVKRWFAAGDLPFVAIFSEEPGTFSLVDRAVPHPDVHPGECIRGEGEIEVMSGTRPFIDIQGVVLPCP